MTDEWTFLYGFFVGQLVLVLTVAFLVKQFLLTSKKQKYEPLCITRKNSQHRASSGSNELEALNFIIKELHDSPLVENALQELSIFVNTNSADAHPLLHSLAVQAVQLDAPPQLQALWKTETTGVELQWVNGPMVQLKGELGRFGVYLPFSAQLHLRLLRTQANLQVTKAGRLCLLMDSFDLDFESDISIGHTVQLRDNQGHLKEILHALIRRHASSLINKPIDIFQ